MKIYMNINYHLNNISNLNLCYMIFLNELHDFFQRYWFMIWRYINSFRSNLRRDVLRTRRSHVVHIDCLTISLKDSIWKWDENIPRDEDFDWEMYFSSKMIRWSCLFAAKFIEIEIFSEKYLSTASDFHLPSNLIYSFDILMIIIILITSHLKKWFKNKMKSNFIWKRISLILFMNHCLLKRFKFRENKDSIFD